jgi:hypothetical protein
VFEYSGTGPWVRQTDSRALLDPVDVNTRRARRGRTPRRGGVPLPRDASGSPVPDRLPGVHELILSAVTVWRFSTPREYDNLERRTTDSMTHTDIPAFRSPVHTEGPVPSDRLSRVGSNGVWTAFSSDFTVRTGGTFGSSASSEERDRQYRYFPIS